MRVYEHDARIDGPEYDGSFACICSCGYRVSFKALNFGGFDRDAAYVSASVAMRRHIERVQLRRTP